LTGEDIVELYRICLDLGSSLYYNKNIKTCCASCIMVKNKTGGNRAKKFARKNTNESVAPRKLRFVELEDEMYAVVTKIMGNGQVQVLGSDDKERLCFIRYKFSGRNKHGNLVNVGSWVIVGNRSWETTNPEKLPKCDLLEIYTHQEKSRLIQEAKSNLSALLKEDQKQMHLDESQEGGDVLFTWEENDEVNTGSGAGVECGDEGGGSEDGEGEEESEINFDEI